MEENEMDWKGGKRNGRQGSCMEGSKVKWKIGELNGMYCRVPDLKKVKRNGRD
jgi:hypothetical protein